MKRLTGCLALAALAVSPALVRDVDASESDVDALESPLGVVDNRLFDEAKDAGADWMRVPIQWKFIERGDDNFTFGAESFWLDNLEDRTMRMSPVVVIGKCWASHRPGDDFEPDDDPETIEDYPSRAPADLSTTWSPVHGYSESYYDFIFTFVTEYAGRIDRLTIENEVNATNFWEDPIEDYLRVLATAKKAAMDADPSVLVFDSGMGSGSWGAPVAEDRYNAGTWDWVTTRNWLRDYYDRDVYVRIQPQLATLWAVTTQSALDTWFAGAIVRDNYARVTTVLDNLFSADFGGMIVDGLNLKYTGDPWLQHEVVAWIDERIADAGQSPLPTKVNNEASNWCVDHNDFDSFNNVCMMEPSDFPILADEMVKKILVGLDAGIEQSLWFPLSNETSTNEATPRLGLFDYSGQPTESLDAFRRLGRFTGGNRDFVSRTTTATYDRFTFEERVLDREDVHVLFYDDGSHGSGSTMVTLDVPAGTVFARQYTADGDSTDLVVTSDQVTVSIDERPSFVYFDDDVTPIQGEVEPTGVPAPSAWTLGAPSPNPSSGRVWVRFGVPAFERDVRVDVFDVGGRRVAPLFDGDLPGGTYRLSWDGTDVRGHRVADGVYFVRFVGRSVSGVRRVTISR